MWANDVVNDEREDELTDDCYLDGFDDIYEELDPCYECGGYGDDYFINDDGELECCCPTCPFNPSNRDAFDDD